MRVAGALGDLSFEVDERSFHAVATMTLSTTGGPLDLCLRPDGTRGYPDLIEHAATFEIFGLCVRVASLDDIIRSKTAAGREADLIALPTLHKLRERLTRRDVEAGPSP